MSLAKSKACLLGLLLCVPLLWLLWPPLLDPLASAKDGASSVANSNAPTIPAMDFIDAARAI